ncbi:hypothetical protein DFH07DRAFT_823032 [Mycena maculata]|uniref:TEA domain-containing protein n=1 Tax=Mycena maculata TaxID=230809 RepID=A0AAD7J2B5_9AGAR|nr:hypothetical protein DFH07DRAFT_823032 [Mycena maculata]
MPAPCSPPGVSSSRCVVSISTIEAMGRTLTSEEQETYEGQLELTRRRRFRNVKGCSEAVWPPHLEAVLIQGLYQYLRDHKDVEALSARRNARNQYLSNIILATTNHKRTATQISSRLQQLSASTNDPRIRDLIRCYRLSEVPLIPTQICPHPPVADNVWHGRTMRIPVTVATRSASYPSFPPEVDIQSSPQCISLRTYVEWQPHTTVLRGMDPTITLSSSLRLSQYSKFELSKNSLTYPSTNQTVRTLLTPTGISGGKWRYTASIADASWDSICDDCDDPGRRAQWTILQLIFSAEDENVVEDRPVAKILYSFEPMGFVARGRRPSSPETEPLMDIETEPPMDIAVSNTKKARPVGLTTYAAQKDVFRNIFSEPPAHAARGPGRPRGPFRGRDMHRLSPTEER